MMENNTDRLFWTLSAIIVTSLVFVIAVKVFPNTARSIRNTIIYSATNGKDHTSVKDSHYEKVHKQLLANQKANDSDTNYTFNYSSTDNTATVMGYKSIPDNKKVIIPNIIKHDGKEYKVTAIAPNSFSHANIESVVLPNNLQTVGLNAFQYNNISTLVLNDNLTSIQAYAFDNNNLSNVSLPASSKLNIDANAFTSNHLKQVILPNKNINTGAFDTNVTFRYQLADNANKNTEAPFDSFKNTTFRVDDDDTILKVDYNQKAVVDKDGNIVKNTFVRDNRNRLYYLDSAGIPMTGIQYLDGNTYDFSTADGSAQVNLIANQNGNRFYFDNSGKLVINKKINYQGIAYYAGSDGSLSGDLKAADGTLNNGGVFQ